MRGLFLLRRVDRQLVLFDFSRNPRWDSLAIKFDSFHHEVEKRGTGIPRSLGKLSKTIFAGLLDLPPNGCRFVKRSTRPSLDSHKNTLGLSVTLSDK